MSTERFGIVAVWKQKFSQMQCGVPAEETVKIRTAPPVMSSRKYYSGIEGVPIPMMSTTVLCIDAMQQADGSSHKNQLEEMTKVIASRRHFFYLIALRQLRNSAAAEDAIQDAFFVRLQAR